MEHKFIQNGKGHVIGTVDVRDDGSKLVRDSHGKPVAKYWANGDFTTDLRTGRYFGKCDQTMRTLCDE